MKKLLLTTCIAFIGLSVFATIQTVDVGNGGSTYSPSALTIDLGDTVRFVWFGGTHPTAPDTTGDWTVFTMSSSNTAQDLLLTNAGTYPYHCQFHGGAGGVGMSGTITVLDTGSSPTTTPYTGQIVRVEDFKYVPDSVHIEIGDTVRFIWTSGDHPTQSIDASWTTFQMNSNDTLFDVILNTDGVYYYFCQNHGSSDGNGGVNGMAGQIVVGDPVINSTNENFNNTFLVGPNPFLESISIIHNYNDLKSIEIVNVVGSQVKSFEITQLQYISLSDLDSGIYFVKAYNNKNELLNTVKIIKK